MLLPQAARSLLAIVDRTSWYESALALYAKVRSGRRFSVVFAGKSFGAPFAKKDWIAAFGLSAIVLPDIADSLDGHMIDAGFSTLSYGGTSPADIGRMAESAATLVIGRSLGKAADLLREKTSVPDYRFAGLMGLEECDAFTKTLSEIAGCPIPARIERQCTQLQDAMVDCQFQLGGARVGIAADADLLSTITRFLVSMGAEVVAAVASSRADHLADLPIESVIIGDLEDLEWLSRERGAELIVTNSHGAGG
jgi:nitrogenase molybdenum-iron protein NifN